VVVEKAAEARENDQERKMEQKAAGDSATSTCYPLMFSFSLLTGKPTIFCSGESKIAKWAMAFIANC